MFYINKITSNHTVDYAAEELKKYLRMMMPEGGDVVITYDPDAKDGFRLGLMQDFGLDVSDAEDPELESTIYQYGRYELISGSRPGNLPVNLQGIWNDKVHAAWACD